MSDTPFEWGGEHFCKPDATELYNLEAARRITAYGFPVQLDTNPVPATFCAVCLQWFDDPAHDNKEHHEQGHTGTQDTGK